MLASAVHYLSSLGVPRSTACEQMERVAISPSDSSLSGRATLHANQPQWSSPSISSVRPGMALRGCHRPASTLPHTSLPSHRYSDELHLRWPWSEQRHLDSQGLPCHVFQIDPQTSRPALLFRTRPALLVSPCHQCSPPSSASRDRMLSGHPEPSHRDPTCACSGRFLTRPSSQARTSGAGEGVNASGFDRS